MQTRIFSDIREFTKKLLPEKENEWLVKQPLDRTLGEFKTLPYPTVYHPSASELAGKELRTFPGYIALEMTNVCNLACTHCNYRHGVAHYTRERGFITDEIVEKTLREVRPFACNVLMNYDGEPLANKSFMKYLEMASELGVNAWFNTNGTLFTPAFTDRLLEFYKGSIFFSVDGNKEWFEKIRIGANYDQVVSHVDYFLKKNEDKGYPVTVGISLCNLGQSPEERKHFLDRWLPKVHYVSMSEVNDKMGTIISDKMTVYDLKKRPTCMMPFETMGVCHNGDVVPCSIYITRANTAQLPGITKKGDAVFGNVMENTLQEIWNNDSYKKFRTLLAGGNVKNTLCEKCERWHSQFKFPDVVENGVRMERNGYWTTFHNLSKGELNFKTLGARQEKGK